MRVYQSLKELNMILKNRLGLGVLALGFTVASCDQPATEPQFDHATAHASYAQVSAGELSGLAKTVRQVTARFNSTTQAIQAGYVADPVCVAVPGLGGMGFHWVNGGLVDPVFDALKPEVVLYEQTKNGQYRLVAVEYIVIDVGQPAPTFDGQPFDVGGTPVPVPHWSLHVWAHKENPAGLFVPFNPSVVCN
jgi:hypothetical protein